MTTTSTLTKIPASHAHIPAPTAIKQLQKYYQKLPFEEIVNDDYVLDLNTDLSHWHTSKIHQLEKLDHHQLNKAWREYLEHDAISDLTHELTEKDKVVYAHSSIPGLKIIPSLLPISVQEEILKRSMFRDLANPKHLTNLHPHYHIPYDDSKSLFDLDQSYTVLPRDSAVHKAVTIREVLNKRLRWMTLGGQYDWTEKVYPDSPVVPFPEDLARLIQDLFPEVKAEAAICNFYSPGDVLSPHRDVSEEADADLISLSIGCDAIFLISVLGEEDEDNIASTSENLTPQPPQPQDIKKGKKKMKPPCPLPSAYMNERTLLLRVHSGDVIVMSGASRWAWHGVPKILERTCPMELEEWPGEEKGNELMGWMKRKRINLNVRQMFPT